MIGREKRASWIRWGLVVLLMGVLLAGAACAKSTVTSPSTTPTPVSTPASGSSGVATPAAGTTQTGVSSVSYQQSASDGAPGISVSGNGTLQVEPDTAIVSLGVEARAVTVAAARDAAATAMTGVIDAIKAQGVADNDIQTTGFSVQPQYVYTQVTDKLGTYQRSQIIGYIVTNSITATVRDLTKVPAVIDDASAKAGDLIRVNSVSFSLSNPGQYGDQVRKLAAQDAKAKAQLYADAMGVQLGSLVSLTETSTTIPVVRKEASLAPDASGAATIPTPINAGTITISAYVQAQFAISAP